MWKCTFKYLKSYPQGGDKAWVEVIRLFDAENALILEDKIFKYTSDEECGYASCKKLIDVVRL